MTGTIASDLTSSRDPLRTKPDLVGRTVFTLIVVYLVMNRAIPDLMVVPIGFSIRPYEIVLLLLGGAWAVWMLADPLPFPRGIVGLVGLALVTVLTLAPYVNALNATPFQINGAERGLFRVFLLTVLFLATYHLATYLSYGRKLIGWVIGVTVVQALLGIYEFLTQRPLTFMFDFARSLGLVIDPKAIRTEAIDVVTRLSGEVRATGTAPHPIVLSALIALGVLLAGAWFVYASNRHMRLLLGLGAAALVIAMPVPNSRTGFVIVAVAVLPLIVAMIKELPRIIPVLLALSMLLGVAFAVSPQTPRLLLDSITRSDEDQNTQIRIERFGRVPELLEERPIIGAGYLTHDTENVQLFDNAFNMAIVEFGILGFVLTLWFLLACLVRSWAGSIRARRDEIVLTIGGISAVFALLAGAATFDAWTFDQFLPTAIIVLAVGVGRSDVILRSEAAQVIDATSDASPRGSEIFVTLTPSARSLDTYGGDDETH